MLANSSLLVNAQDAASPDLLQLKSLDMAQLLQVQVATVSAASGFEQKITEAPSSISIVYSEEIKRHGYRTLADILQSLQGFNVSYDRNYSYLGTRGVSLGDANSRILLLVDGHRMNNNLDDGAAIGTDFLLDVDLIDRVEVIRGPSAVLYGNNAFFGVINVITRKGGQVNGVEASAEYGTFDTYKVRVSAGKSFTNGLEFLVSGTYYNSAGPTGLFYPYFNSPSLNVNNGVARNMNADTYKSFFGSVSYQDFTLEGGYIIRENVDPTAQNFTSFNDPRSRTTEERGYIDLKYVHELPWAVDLTARTYYDWNKFKVGYPYGEPVGTDFAQEVKEGEWFGAQVQLTKRLWDKHTISVGAEYRDDFRQSDQGVYDGISYLNVSSSRQSHGVFVQGDFTLRSDLNLNAGVRYDQYGNFDPSYSPRLAIIYTPFEQSTFKAIYGSAFRDPNFQELSDPRFQNIQPEQITSYELVYEQGIDQHLRSSVSGYYNQMDHLILYQNGAYENVNAEAEGLELALEAKFTNGVMGRVSYSLQRTENRSGGLAFPDSPEHLVKFNFSVPLLRDMIFAGLEYQFTSSRLTEATTSSGTTVAGPNTPGFGIFNATLFSKNLLKNLEVSASVYNLLDTAHSDPASLYHLQSQIPQDGRSFRFKLTYKF